MRAFVFPNIGITSSQPQLDTIISTLTTLQSTVTTLQATVATLNNEFNVTEYDIWTERGRTEIEQRTFKDDMIKYYKRSAWWQRNKLRCMVTDQWHTRGDVIACHIWMNKTRGKGLAKFGLAVNDLMDNRNGFLALKDIEDKFDRKQLCFLYSPLTDSGKFLVKVLDPTIRDSVIRNSNPPLTFGNVDGFELQHPSGRFPYRRLLGFHARCSYKNAKEKGWIPADSVFDEYFNISETASAPDTYV